MARNKFTDWVLPLIIFPLLTAAAAKFMFGHLYESGLAQKVDSHCGKPFHGYSDWLSIRNFLVPYTGFAEADSPGICGLIVFFHALLESPKPLPYIEYFVGTGAPYVLLVIIEGYRKDRSKILSYITIWLLLTQFVSYGATFPTYCLIWVTTGGVKSARQFDARSFTQAHAESFIFSMIVGGVLPSIAMFLFDDPFVTWIWQLFPIYISISQTLYLQIRPPSRHSQSGYSTMRVAYIGTFLVSACVHLVIIWTQKDDVASLVKLLVPSTTLLNPSTDISTQVLHFLKWDYNLGYIAAAISLLWFAQSASQLVKILVWYVVATPLLGLGTAVMGVAMWRDGILG